jgi:hypothetical protein
VSRLVGARFMSCFIVARFAACCNIGKVVHLIECDIGTPSRLEFVFSIVYKTSVVLK